MLSGPRVKHIIRTLESNDLYTGKILLPSTRSIEHVYPKSRIDSTRASKDMHNLYLVDRHLNSRRSNKSFHKFKIKRNFGQVSRSVAYMMLMYHDRLLPCNPPILDLETVVRWHEQYPVTDHELYRNEVIWKLQGNENCMISMPKDIPYDKLKEVLEKLYT